MKSVYRISNGRTLPKISKKFALFFHKFAHPFFRPELKIPRQYIQTIEREKVEGKWFAQHRPPRPVRREKN